MKKMMKAGAALAIASVLIVAGVFAAITAANWNVTSTVTFSANNCFVTVQGAYNIGSAVADDSILPADAENLAATEYLASTYSGNGKFVALEEWQLGNLDMGADGEDVLTMIFKFTNDIGTFIEDSETEVEITIGLPDAITGTTLSYEIIDGDGSTDDGDADEDEYTATIGDGEYATLIFTLTIDDELTDFSEDFSFTVTLENKDIV